MQKKPADAKRWLTYLETFGSGVTNVALEGNVYVTSLQRYDETFWYRIVLYATLWQRPEMVADIAT
ncbi:hypothetical protein DPMN_190316 [Dreissena polymorpha]|uniref:Uncharacterized protein n=1 Tax=Dreissena polymorpha TaxID=45954 RepID=A0A9D4ID78_DREPO|nr:hypothetical protein DPMN_190316 [Dreissena polymorpha]